MSLEVVFEAYIVCRLACDSMYGRIDKGNFSLFHSELKTYFFRKSYNPPFLSIGLISWLKTVYRISLLISFYVLYLFLSNVSYSSRAAD